MVSKYFGTVDSSNTTINSWGHGDKQTIYTVGQGGEEGEEGQLLLLLLVF